MPRSSSKEHPGRNFIVQLASSVTITTGASIFKSVETSIVTIVLCKFVGYGFEKNVD
ncbi:hypothetical protein ARMGADRAFT_1016143, partial [Armillaria gallica]